MPEFTTKSGFFLLFIGYNRFFLFIGYNRSRHTLFAPLLDAHPHVVVANDLNILKQWITMPEIFGLKKYFIYEPI